jgi:EAL domain-containing protein (putative c-di-GMP-specific phosphodiesterase class I)
VRDQACRAMKLWHVTEPKLAPATVSVNVSRVELAQASGFHEQIAQLLEAAQLPASRLQIEVTESNVMRNPEATLKVMRDLKTLGVRIAMDDFGTGASSLSLLRSYPFDVVKIDRSFVDGLVEGVDVRAVIHATIGLVERLGMLSLVEGIEKSSQLSLLCSMGCGLGQGWLFSPPVPAGQVLNVARRLRTEADVFIEETRRSPKLMLG